MFISPLSIVTTSCAQSAILHTKTTDFQEDELPFAKEIVINPIFTPIGTERIKRWHNSSL